MARSTKPRPIRPSSTLHFAGGLAVLLLIVLSACDQATPTVPAPASTVVAPTVTPSQQVSPVSTQPATETPPRPSATVQVTRPQDTPAPTATAVRATTTPVPPQVAPPSPTAAPPTATLPVHTPTAVPAPATRVPSSTPQPTQTLVVVTATATVLGTSSGHVEEIASGFGSPDDLVVAPSGDIIFGDFGNKAVNIIRAGSNTAEVLAAGIAEPEGLVVTADGAIIVADQATNRILEINYQTGEIKVLRRLVNNTGQDGVDGLGLDPATGDILIPDSPNGRLLRMSRDGSSLKTIATGFVRPTCAAVEVDGSIVVADEFGNAVYRVHDGSRTKLADIFQPDDVMIGQDGSIYVNSLGGDIVRIDPATRKSEVLLSGLKLPHGLGIDGTGRLVIGEAGRNRIFRLTP